MIKNMLGRLASLFFGALTFILLTFIGYGMTIVAALAALLIVPFAALNKAVEVFGN